MVLKELLNNMLVLVVLSYLYSLLYRFREKSGNQTYRLLSGLLFGFMAMLVIYSPFLLAPGIRIDGRSIILACAGYFGGITTAIPAVIISSIFRLVLGGVGAITGVGIIITSALTGIIFRYLVYTKKLKRTLVNNYLFGLVIHIEMMLWMFTLPSPISFTVINQTTVPVLLMFPLATVWAIQMVADQERKYILEKQLKSNQRRLINAQVIANIGHWEYSPSEDKLIVSSNLLKILKIKDKNKIQSFENLREYIALESKSYVETVYKESLEFMRPYNIEYQMHKDNGDIIYVNEICQTEYSQTGEVLKVFGTIQDITENKKAELLLKNSEQEYRNLFSSIRDILVVIDSSLIIQNANPAFWSKFKYDRGEIKGNSIEPLFNCPKELSAFEDLIQGKRVKGTLIYSYLCANGRVFKGETRVSSISGMKGSDKQFIVIIRDVTNQIMQEQELRNYKENLENMIEKRTKELKEANEGLIDLNKSFVGREFRIKDLKEENSILKLILKDSGINYENEKRKLISKEKK